MKIYQAYEYSNYFLTAQDDTTELKAIILAQWIISRNHIQQIFENVLIFRFSFDAETKLEEMNKSHEHMVQDKTKEFGITVFYRRNVCGYVDQEDGFLGDHARRTERYMDV